jgi:hypothetical protein
MKNIIALSLIFFFSLTLKAQDCSSLDMIKEGTKWELTNYNKKDKVDGSTFYHVKEVSNKGDGGVSWIIDMEMKDDKGEVFSESTTEISCEAGVFKMSMEQFMNNEQMQAYKDMDVEIDATDIEYPTSTKVGATLPEASINIKVATNGMTVMNMTTTIKDRRIEKEETIETPAGSFDCLIVTQNTTIANKLISKEYPSKDWFMPGFGVVRSESYKSNGKLIGYSVLTSYEQ